MMRAPFVIGRREAIMGLVGMSIMPGYASAARLSPPCPTAPGDITGLTLEGTGNPAGAVAVFGQVFRPGHLPAGSGLRARLANGQPLPVQLDIRSQHPDGSVRFALVSLAAPALAAGQSAKVVLSAGPTPAAGGMPQANGRQAAVEIIGPGGETWRMELLPRAFTGRLWQAGPLAVQGRVEAPVPPGAAGGVTSLRLVADLALHADGALRLDAWFRNDTAMQPGGGTARYTARLVLDGKEAARFDIPRQWQYTGWGRLFVSRPGGPPPWVRHDAGYLTDAGAVARYNLRTGVDDSVIAGLAAAMASPGWQAPLSARQITQDMRQTGGRADIGPATMSQAAWLITSDRRAAAYAIGQAEAAGAVPWHLWDPQGGDGRGGWLDAKRWPRLWTDGRGGPPPGGLAQPVSEESGWIPDAAHQPDLCFVPYVLTGRRAFLDGLQAQASWCVVSQWTGVRGTPDRPGPGEGFNIVRSNQVRGAAWSLRQLSNAAWITGQDDPNSPYLRTCADGNWAWVRSRIPGWTAEQGELHGCIPGAYGAPGTLPPWQQDYFASTAAAAARRGDADAMAVLRWMSNFLVGRFLSAEKGFNPRDGVAYLIAADPGAGEARPLRSWAETGNAMRAKGLSNENGWSKSEGVYGQLALQSLAALVELTGTAEAQRAYAWLSASGAPFTRPQDFRRDPLFSIVPNRTPTCGA
ncbi:hypothetical protein [Roseomonas marmotae]|uniref:Cellulase Ig-like domain-containing protein n=1 Tax=Roseomonas marmotae TaxID=2768161 RepID=A0ABS3KH46_9PROT|nr:hypothetical protein [Roseomonas marmotae]MBO1076774.1 hypothetical protein [Roseomonas marmotae]QTI78698.1 hypothetical protein IAI58_13665 [Roseomonas marmotae]